MDPHSDQRMKVVAQIVEHFRAMRAVDEGNWSHEGVAREVEREFGPVSADQRKLNEGKG